MYMINDFCKGDIYEKKLTTMLGLPLYLVLTVLIIGNVCIFLRLYLSWLRYMRPAKGYLMSAVIITGLVMLDYSIINADVPQYSDPASRQTEKALVLPASVC